MHFNTKRVVVHCWMASAAFLRAKAATAFISVS